MYAILHGKVKIVQTTEDGTEIIIGMHQASDIFGEISLIDGRLTATAVADTDDYSVAELWLKRAIVPHATARS